VEPALDAALHRAADLVAVQGREQAVAGGIQRLAQRFRVATVDAGDGALRALAERREGERQDQRGDDVEHQRLLARDGGEQSLPAEHDGQVDRREHAGEERVREPAHDQPPRVEHQVPGDEIGEHDRRREPEHEQHAQEHMDGRDRGGRGQQRVHQVAAEADVAHEHGEPDDHGERALARRGRPAGLAAAVAQEQRRGADHRGRARVPRAQHLGRHQPDVAELEQQQQRHRVAHAREPEPGISRARALLPARAREHRHEVDEARRVEQHQRVVEREVAAEAGIGLDLRVREHRAQHAEAVERGVPEEDPGGAEIRAPPHEQERHQRRRHRHGDRRRREAEALPRRETRGRQRDAAAHAVALELQLERTARPAFGGDARTHGRVFERDAVERQQPVAGRERAARGRPEDLRHHAARPHARAEPRVGSVREESRQRHAESGEQCRHRQESPDAHVGSHLMTIPQ
jgi:hypothetical protein